MRHTPSLRLAPRGGSLASLLLLLTAAAPVAGQATGDQSRLVIGVSGGYIGGVDLWSVAAQPIVTNTEARDVFALDRRLRSNISFIGQATWFPRDNMGFTGEVAYIGLGTVDQCTLVTASGDPLNRLVCRTLDGNPRPASAVSVGGGVVIRPLSRAALQPYVRGTAGFTLAPRSTVRTIATIGTFGDTAFTVYPQVDGNDAKLTGSVAFGLATSATPGYQFRIELRGTMVRLPIVTGPSIYQGEIPPTTNAWKALPSLLVGFDIVLEKRRGRRY